MFSKSGFLLIFGFGTIILFTIAISTISYLYISEMSSLNNEIVHLHEKKHHLAAEMREFALRRFLVVSRMMHTRDVFEVDALKMVRIALGGEYVYRLQKLARLPMNNQEKELIGLIREKARNSSIVIDKIIAKLENENYNQASIDFEEFGSKRQTEVYQLLKSFENFQNNASRAAENRFEKLQMRHRLFHSLSSLFIVVSGLFMAIYVVRRIGRSEEQLAVERNHAVTALTSIQETVITLDRRNKIYHLNEAGSRMLGITTENALGKKINHIAGIRCLIDNTDCTECRAECCNSQQCPKGAKDLLLTNKTGDEFHVELQRSQMRDDNSQLLGQVVVVRDITLQRRLARHLEEKAHTDILTGLQNRHAFEKELDALRLNMPDRQHLACYLDLDHFKSINDTCGHMAGDEAIKQISSLFKSNCRKTDMLARLGGDEFVVLMPDCGQKAGERFCQRVIEEVSKYRFAWNNVEFTLGVSIGVFVITDILQCDLNRILNAADTACYRAKYKGRNTYAVYRPGDERLGASQV